MNHAAVNRRSFVAGGLAVALVPSRARATPEAMQAALLAVTGGAPLHAGRVTLDLPPLVDNGNSVPLSVSVDSPMTAADHVRAIHIFNQKNPQPDVLTCHMGPRCGRAALTTRIKLADTQVITAVAAMSDGTFHVARADVIVTIAACLEDPA